MKKWELPCPHLGAEDCARRPGAVVLQEGDVELSRDVGRRRDLVGVAACEFTIAFAYRFRLIFGNGFCCGNFQPRSALGRVDIWQNWRRIKCRQNAGIPKLKSTE